jgi:hypothetical protein
VWLIGKQKHKNGMAGEIFRAGQDPQRIVLPIIIIIIIIIIFIMDVFISG